MAPKIGYPHDPVKLAQKKEQTLHNLLTSSTTAWHGYFGTMALAYEAAHKQHAETLGKINESIRNKQRFLREVLLGAIIPAMIGGPMGFIVENAGSSILTKLLGVAGKARSRLVEFGTVASSTAVEDGVKVELGRALNGLVAEPGSAWDAVGPTPLEFFLKFNKMVDNYSTNVTQSVTLAKATARGFGEEYIDTLNAHLLSPFIQNAPMDLGRFYNENELAPIYEIFLWIHWARQRDVKYWSTRIYSATATDPMEMATGGYKVQQEYIDAAYEMQQLDPIKDRLEKCWINTYEVTTGLVTDPDTRVLNILWLRFLGSKHRDSLLFDLVDNLDAKVPKSDFDDKPFDRSRRLK